MNSFKRYKIFILLTAFVVSLHGLAQNGSRPKEIIIAKDALADKIAGGFLGQVLGNLNGLQHEFKYLDTPGTVSNYIPCLPDGAFTDDDTDIEWVYLTEMARSKTVLLSFHCMMELWQAHINGKIWSANRFARQLFDLGIEPPLSGKATINNWSDFNIAGMFVSESFGLCSPFMPQAAATIGVHYTSVSVDAEPLQATQLITTMIATAFGTNDVQKIVAAAIEVLDKKSVVFSIVQQVQNWCVHYPGDWKKVRVLIQNKYTDTTLSGGARHVRNMNGYRLNVAATVAAILLGKGEFIPSVTHAFNFGWDADCNAATVGAITGVIKGKKWMDAQGWQIKDVYKNTTRPGMPQDETITSYAKKIIDVAAVVIQQNSGRSFTKNGKDYFLIKPQQPKNILPLADLQNERPQLALSLKEKIFREYKTADVQTKARAAYLAIATDLYKELKAADEAGWMEAVAALETYPRVLDLLLKSYPGPLAQQLSSRALDAGVRKPAVAYQWPADY